MCSRLPHQFGVDVLLPTSNICRLSAAAMMRVKLCFPGDIFPVYTMSSTQENSWEDTKSVSMQMLPVPSSRDLRQRSGLLWVYCRICITMCVP